MATRTRRTLGTVMVAGLAIGSAVALTSTSASGVEGPTPIESDGTLTINLTDGEGEVELLVDGTTTTEPIQTAQPCAAIEPLSGTLLQFVANDGNVSADTVQIRNSGLGISTSNTSCGNSNAGTINKSESLTIELAPNITSQGLVAESVTLNVDRFKRGDLLVGFDGGPLTQVPVGTAEGELSGYPGTVILTPAAPFTTMTVSSTANNNAGVSVVDGTSFDLTSPFAFAVFCEEEVSDDATGEIATSATFFRAQNGEKSDDFPCEDVGVNIEIQDDRVFWDNATVGVDGNPQDVAGIVTIEFAPIPTAGKSQADIDAILDREIDYDAEGPAPFTDSLWCLSFTENADGTISAAQPNIGVGTPGANADGTAPWCEVENDSQLINGEIFQTVTLFGSGDPYFR